MEITAIGLQILAYLVDHPEAQDTLDGIVEWWLLERRIKDQTKMIKEALFDLVHKGLILERQEKDLRSRYGINQNEIARVMTFLKGEAK